MKEIWAQTNYVIDYDWEDSDGALRSERHLFSAPRTALHFAEAFIADAETKNVTIWRRRLVQWKAERYRKSLRNWQHITIHRLRTEAFDTKTEPPGWEHKQPGRPVSTH